MKILGVHYGHDSSAALIVDGEIVADAQEERFTRIKNDSTFPLHAIRYCLDAASISSNDVDVLAVPSTTPGEDLFVFLDVPAEIRPTLPIARHIKSKIKQRFKKPPVLPLYIERMRLHEGCRLHLVHHHRAHAASAFYTSGIDQGKALIITMDGVGEGCSVCIWRGEGNKMTLLQRFGPEGSLAWFYGNATEALGWRHGSDEWKLMGLAPYGETRPGALRGFYPEYSSGELVKPHAFGEFGVWNDHGANHWHGEDAAALSTIAENIGRENFAAEVQRVAEEQAEQIILPWLEREGMKNLCCAGGFFLNVKLNQNIWYKGILERQWIYPNPGDAGLAVGAALDAWHSLNPDAAISGLAHVYLGPAFADDAIEAVLRERMIPFTRPKDLVADVAELLAANKVVGWFQGRMESGPRALGNRSILMSPLKKENKDIINAKVKYREAFRPFCPSVLADHYHEYFEAARDERFMVSSFRVREEKKKKIPAVVHEDGTARPQLVERFVNPLYYDLIKAFGDRTGEYVLLNTSFNVKGEPIVCNPREAIKCFYDTGMDALALGPFLIKKPDNRGMDVV